MCRPSPLIFARIKSASRIDNRSLKWVLIALGGKSRGIGEPLGSLIVLAAALLDLRDSLTYFGRRRCSYLPRKQRPSLSSKPSPNPSGPVLSPFCLPTRVQRYSTSLFGNLSGRHYPSCPLKPARRFSVLRRIIPQIKPAG